MNWHPKCLRKIEDARRILLYFHSALLPLAPFLFIFYLFFRFSLSLLRPGLVLFINDFGCVAVPPNENVHFISRERGTIKHSV